MNFAVSRFLFAPINSSLRSSEISSLIQLCLNANENTCLASGKYYLYFDKSLGEKLFFGKMILGFPQNLEAPLFYQDFGGEKVLHQQIESFNLEELSLLQIKRKMQSLEEKFDHKIEKVLFSIDIESNPAQMGVDIFVE